MKLGYTAVNRKTKEHISFFAYTTETANKIGGNALDARNWIINNLDTSYIWDYYFNGKFRL